MDTTNNFQQSVNDNLKVFANYQPKGQLGNGTFELSDVGAVARNVGGSLVGGVLSTAEALSDPVLAAYYSLTGRQSKARDIYLNSWSQTATDYLRGDDTGGNTMQFVNSIAQGVGEQGTRLAISLGLAAITVGVVNPALTQNVLLGASAFGSGMQKAVQQTGELGVREHLYGIGSGLIEFGTEKLSDVAGLYGGSSKTIGGALGLLNVDGWTSKLLGQYANTVGGKLARTFMGEFGEEALSEILDVPLSKLTIDENASTSLKDVLAAGVQGGIVGAIMGGGQEVLNKSNYTKRGNDIVNNNLQSDVLREGLELGNDYATYLQNRINAGAEVTPTQYGKLAMENQAKIVESGVEEIKDKYGIKSDKEARKKYADEVALDMMYANNGAGMFLTDETNTAENENAIEAYVQNGGSLDDLSDAARMLDRKGITVNYVYDTANNAEGTTIDGNNVTINLASEKFKSQIASHESYHTLSDEAKANLYNEISQTQWYKDNGQKILDRYSYEKTGDERTKKYTDEMRQEEVGARYMEHLINNPKAFIKEMQGKSDVIDDLKAFFKGYNKYSKNLPKSEKKAINKVYNEFLDAMKESATAKEGVSNNVKFSLKGVNKNGYEVYETSAAVMAMPIKERIALYKKLIEKDYAGRTAKFNKNGEIYYARFNKEDVNKHIYGDKESDVKGKKAKIRVGADGNIFELVENAKYDHSSNETGKTNKAHKGITSWDYYQKTVQIDNSIYDVFVNVRLGNDGEYVYNIQLNEDKTKSPQPPRRMIQNHSSNSGSPETSYGYIIHKIRKMSILLIKKVQKTHKIIQM